MTENFDVKKIIGEIVDRKDLSMQQLQERLNQILSGKRSYLLVLDDVWNEEVGKWKDLKELFVCGDCGSKIVATTRRYYNHEHNLQGLSQEDSLSLLMKWAFRESRKEG